jgi:hemoglobin/transferrin/lactoferrin receptor protein
MFPTNLRRHLAPFIFCLALAPLAARVGAQEPTPPADPPAATTTATTDEAPADSFFATTTVTATGWEADSFEVSTPVTVIDQKLIDQRHPDNAAALLRGETGVDVNGVGPNQERPIIRGLRGLRVLFMENGLRLNNVRRQTDFGEITGLFAVDDLDRVEVVRGPASVLYGSDAIGGVLNLITQAPPYLDGRWLGGSVGFSHSSAGDQNLGHATLRGRNERWSFQLGLTKRDAGDYKAAAGRYGQITLTDDTQVIDSGVEDTTAYGFVGFDLTPSQELTVRYNRYRAEQTGFGFVDPGLLGESSDFAIRIIYPYQDFDRVALAYNGSALATPLIDSVRVQAFHQQNGRALDNRIDINIGPIFPGAPDSGVHSDTHNVTDLDTLGLRAEAIKGLSEQHMLTYGLDATRDDSENTDRSVTTATIRFPFPPFAVSQTTTDTVPNAPNAKNQTWGVFVQDEYTPLDRLKVTLGGRYQKVSTKAEATPGWDVAGLDFDDSSTVGSLNFLYRASQSIHVVGSVGTAFRAPNIIERLFNGLTPEGSGYQVLNKNLESERSRNWELGLKYRRQEAWFEVNYFDNRITDGIIQDFLSPAEIATLPAEVRAEIEASGVQFVVQEKNIDELRYKGVESAIGYRTRNGVTLGANYSWIDGQRSGAVVVPVDNNYRSKFNAFVRCEPIGKRYWFEYRVRHNGSAKVETEPGEPVPTVGDELPEFTVHAVAGGVTLFERGSQRHQLQMAIDNLTDQLYGEFSNVTFFRPAPGRTLSLSYRIDL